MLNLVQAEPFFRPCNASLGACSVLLLLFSDQRSQQNYDTKQVSEGQRTDRYHSETQLVKTKNHKNHASNNNNCREDKRANRSQTSGSGITEQAINEKPTQKHPGKVLFICSVEIMEDFCGHSLFHSKHMPRHHVRKHQRPNDKSNPNNQVMDSFLSYRIAAKKQKTYQQSPKPQCVCSIGVFDKRKGRRSIERRYGTILSHKSFCENENNPKSQISQPFQ